MKRSERFRVIVADDDELMRETVSDILKLKGFNVITAATGTGVIEATERLHIDLAVLDIKMPGMNGVEVLRKLKEVSPNTKVIFITAYIEDDIAHEAMKTDALAVLSKPFDPERLFQLVDAYSCEWEMSNREGRNSQGNSQR